MGPGISTPKLFQHQGILRFIWFNPHIGCTRKLKSREGSWRDHAHRARGGRARTGPRPGSSPRAAVFTHLQRNVFQTESSAHSNIYGRWKQDCLADTKRTEPHRPRSPKSAGTPKTAPQALGLH